MKKLIFVLTFIAFSAHAEMITQGGFGTDGATNQSFPKTTSVKDANEIYKALDLVPGGLKDYKTVKLEDESEFQCEAPRKGMHTVTGGCSFVLRASQKGKVTNRQGLAGDVTFTGALAEGIFESLNVKPAIRAGSGTKTVGNLSCTVVVSRVPTYKCQILGASVLQMDVEI